jgi:glycine/D-amino acid oxidase-like deaminating enzyme
MDSFALVRSLRQRLLERGVRIHEGDPVLEIVGGRHPVARTAAGQVSAAKVLIASNVWAGSVPELNRYMFAVDAQVVTTQAAPDLLDGIGLVAGRSVCDSQTKVVYWHRTTDGRLVMGQGSGVPIFRDRIGPRSNRNPSLVPDVVRELHRIYPQLAGLEIAHDWVGSVDISASRVPLIGHISGEPNLVYCVGWSGTALAQVPVVARILAGLVAPAVADEWAASRLVDTANRRRIVPEPIRYTGAKLVKGAVDRMVRRELRDLPVDPLTRIAVGLVPKHRTYRPDSAD